MKTILANSKRVKEVSKIHSEISQLYKGLSLEDILIVGFNWNRKKIDEVMNDEGQFFYRHIKKFFYEWDYVNKEGTLSQFRLYNQPAITRHARYRAVFLQDMKRKGYDLSKELLISQLEALSCYSIGYATITYAIKCYLLSTYLYTDWVHRYNGIQPQTGPIHNANELLYGFRMSNCEHTNMCNLLSKELGLSSTYINTAFYTMG